MGRKYGTARMWSRSNELRNHNAAIRRHPESTYLLLYARPPLTSNMSMLDKIAADSVEGTTNSKHMYGGQITISEEVTLASRACEQALRATPLISHSCIQNPGVHMNMHLEDPKPTHPYPGTR